LQPTLQCFNLPIALVEGGGRLLTLGLLPLQRTLQLHDLSTLAFELLALILQRRRANRRDRLTRLERPVEQHDGDETT
jgi:hypothetical protein